jgi:hypothetical protein
MAKYCVKGVRAIRIWYIVACLLWIVLVSALGITKFVKDGVAAAVVCLPLIVFIIGYANADNLSVEDERVYFMNSNVLNLGLIIVLPLLTWVSDRISGHIPRRQYVGILVAALVLAMLALVDVWVNGCWNNLETHVKSSLQTMSLGLLIIALYLFYLYHNFAGKDGDKESSATTPFGAISLK